MGSRTFPEKIDTHETKDGYVTKWWLPCPEGCATAKGEPPCPDCGGSGELKTDPDLALEAAQSACAASDGDPVEIMARRGLW